MSNIICIRGAGDIATGVAQAFYRAGERLLLLETRNPSAIRRSVALSEAVYLRRATVEDMTAIAIETAGDAPRIWQAGQIPVLVDPRGECIPALAPVCVVDATLAKRNLGTHPGLAPVTIALGPGFTAPKDADIVIETMRGHDLGRLIENGSALPNTGVPGEVGGQSALRVVHAPAEGHYRPVASIGDAVSAGQVIAYIGETPVQARIGGFLRGSLREGLRVHAGMKIADIDPRLDEQPHAFTISDKARALGNAAYVAYRYLLRRKGLQNGD